MAQTTVGGLLDEVRQVLTSTRERGRLPSQPAQALDEAISSLDALADQLERLQTLIVLDDYSREDDEMDRARAQWLLVVPERTEMKLDALVSASPTLSTLHRAAVSIVSAFRYDTEKLELAGRMGNWLADHPGYARSMVDERYPDFRVTPTAVKGVASLIDALTASGEASGFEVLGWVEPKNGKPFWKKRSAMNGSWDLKSWKVQRGTIATHEMRDFLRGHWLTAYAYGIAMDQFTRAGKPFEIYSNVQYRLPSDMGGGRSDIDVLVRTADVMVCIECKSGRVLVEHKGQPSAAAKTLANAERLDNVLTTMQVELERHYQLMYVPTEDEPVDLVAGTLGDAVHARTPGDLRLAIQQIANGLPLQRSATETS